VVDGVELLMMLALVAGYLGMWVAFGGYLPVKGM
jgi:hypothetical protein